MTKNKINFLWILNALFLAVVSYALKSPGPEYFGGIYYILYNFGFLALCLVLLKKHSTNFELSPVAFFIGVVMVMCSHSPIFENDHYRYIWEGKVMASGLSPYLLSPDHAALSHIEYAAKNRIGFSNLTTIYPPLGILWFSLVAKLPFEFAFRGLMLLNALLIALVFRFFTKRNTPALYLCVFFPLLQKEYIQAVHIDLFAAVFLLPLFALKEKDGKRTLLTYGLYFMSFWSKLIGVVTLPIFFITNKTTPINKVRSILASAFIPLSLGLFFWFHITDLNLLSGVLSFSKDWVWIPGFYSLLVNLLELEIPLARQITFAAFLMVVTLVHLKVMTRPLQKGAFFEAGVILHSSMIFFSPVFNPWYTIWFLLFSLYTKNKWAMAYAFFSCLSYTPYGYYQYNRLAEVLVHMWYFPILFNYFEVYFKKFYALLLPKRFFPAR
ncbi:MAG: hypothetical protein HOE90_22565 [Bacteriovoracaceae bacterium]|nr:hypothetical protein [Bacteriovoracaceae bacterium]